MPRLQWQRKGAAALTALTRDHAISPMDEDQESPTARRAGTITGRGVRFPPKAEATGSNPVGRASIFNELGLHRPILVCANSPKTHQKLECWIGLPAREVRVAQMEPLLRNGRIERVWGRKNHSAGPAPSLGREDFHSSVSRRGRRTAGSASELITKCCGSERPPLLRRSGASHPPRLPDHNNKPHPETRHKSAEVLGPAAQRLRVRKPCGRIFPTAPVVADTEGMRHRAGLRATSRLRHKQAFAAETIFVIGPLQDLPSSGYDPSSKLARSALNPAFFDNGQQRK